jgi:hypothetical protein
MWDEVQTLALVGMLVAMYFLTEGCKRINESMPYESGQITGKVDGMTEELSNATSVLDDIANLLHEGLTSLPSTSPAQTDNSPLGMILNGLISNMTNPQVDGPKHTEPQEWEVLPNQDDTTTEEATHQG